MNTRPFVEKHIAGDTLEMSIAKGNAITVDGYPASDGWTLKYRLIPQFTSPAQDPIEITASTDSDGASYKIEVSNTSTAAWQAGSYTWARWIEKAGAALTLETDEQCDILQDPRTATAGYDSRSWVRKELERVQTAISALNYGAKAYTIGSRSYTREDLPALNKWRNDLEWKVKNEDDAERLAAGMPNPRNVGVRMIR